MARPVRRDAIPAHTLATSRIADRADYRPGGPVGQMQADLVRRLTYNAVLGAMATVPPGERAVRFVSVAGGGVALLAGYAGVVALILR